MLLLYIKVLAQTSEENDVGLSCRWEPWFFFCALLLLLVFVELEDALQLQPNKVYIDGERVEENEEEAHVFTVRTYFSLFKLFLRKCKKI